jgi:uncharacterized membrane protein
MDINFIALIYLYLCTGITTITVLLYAYLVIKTKEPPVRSRYKLRLVEDAYQLTILSILLALFYFKYIEGWTVLVLAGAFFLPLVLYKMRAKKGQRRPTS